MSIKSRLIALEQQRRSAALFHPIKFVACKGSKPDAGEQAEIDELEASGCRVFCLTRDHGEPMFLAGEYPNESELAEITRLTELDQTPIVYNSLNRRLDEFTFPTNQA